MAQPTIQCSFNSGEWAPHLYARTDLEKYHSGAALLHNFFVDYRGGASTRSGSKYCLRGYKDGTAIRLIPFQAAISVGYALEFGASYIRFYANGAPVLETGLNITGATKASPCVLTVTNTYTTGDVDWVYITGVGGMTQLNGKYYIVHARSSTTVTLYDLFGNPVDSTGYGTYTAGGTTQRIYTLASPYAAADLALLKFVQNVDALIICHPSYPPYQLTFAAPTSWTIAQITFGSSVSAPLNATASSTLSSGNVYYAYVVTALDTNGQESDISAQATLSAIQDLRTVAGTNLISWSPVAGAVSYNIYKAQLSYANPVPVGLSYGFIGNTTATSFPDTNVTADFSLAPPSQANPFATGEKVASVTVTVPGSYTSAAVPIVSFTAAPAGGSTATGVPVFSAVTTTLHDGGNGYAVGDKVTFSSGIVITVVTEGGGIILTYTVFSLGNTVTVMPPNPLDQVGTTGSGTGAEIDVHWGISAVTVVNAGYGYLVTPLITFSGGAAAATANMVTASVGNPSVPTFFDQRLALAAPTAFPNTIYFSQPGNYFNYDVSNPIQDDNAITAAIVSGQLSNIKAMIPQPGGLIVLTDGVSYLINGGSLGSAITPASITANAQSYIGGDDVPPIVVNFDILSIPAKGSSVRDNTYNFYANVFTGTDISVLSSHLFFGYKLLEWAWVEEPYKLVWAVRNDGMLLSLTFIKEQEYTAWTHHDTEGGAGLYKSICTVVEPASVGFQNFIYTVVQRTIGATTVQYIEYTPERATTGLVRDYWTVDCGIQYVGAPATNFSGAEFLAGKTCTGLADGVVIPPFVMPANGNFTLPAASKVTVGLGFVCDLQTLYIDLGQPTVQSKEKKINGVALRVTEALGLSIGSDANNLTAMKDLVVGNIGRMTNQRVADLVTGDAFTYLDSKWQEAGQIYVRQPSPLPATILGYIPQVAVGDTK